MKTIRSLIAILAATFAAGGIGSYFTYPSIPTWYASLTKGPVNPPNWVFGPVWTTLYMLMAVAAWRIWKKRTQPGGKRAFALYVSHLFLNAYWSIAFFSLHDLAQAFAVLLVLWLSIFVMVIWFFRIDRIAGALMLPYLAWVTFAGYLNYTLMTLN